MTRITSTRPTSTGIALLGIEPGKPFDASRFSADEITELEIPTGQPIVYELADDLTARDRYYLSER